MALFNSFTDFLKGPVGNNLKNHPDDVRIAKGSLSHLGYLPEEEHDGNGYITRALDTAIKSFQKDNGLRVDGKMKPLGETEQAIIKAYEKKDRPQPFDEQPHEKSPPPFSEDWERRRPDLPQNISEILVRHKLLKTNGLQKLRTRM